MWMGSGLCGTVTEARLQSALFSFGSFMLVVLLFICACAYVQILWPGLTMPYKTGFRGLFFKAAIIGENLRDFVVVVQGRWS